MAFLVLPLTAGVWNSRAKSLTMLLCQRAGFVPRVAHEARELITMIGLVRAGLGVALVPSMARSHVGEDVTLLRLADSPQAFEKKWERK